MTNTEEAKELLAKAEQAQSRSWQKFKDKHPHSSHESLWKQWYISTEAETLRKNTETAKKKLEKAHFLDLEPGDGVTICYYSDRKPATILSISKNRSKITIQMDKTTLKTTYDGGSGDDQDWTIERDEEGKICAAHWSESKRCYTTNGNPVVPERHKYHDYCF